MKVFFARQRKIFSYEKSLVQIKYTVANLHSCFDVANLLDKNLLCISVTIYLTKSNSHVSIRIKNSYKSNATVTMTNTKIIQNAILTIEKSIACYRITSPIFFIIYSIGSMSLGKKECTASKSFSMLRGRNYATLKAGFELYRYANYKLFVSTVVIMHE